MDAERADAAITPRPFTRTGSRSDARLGRRRGGDPASRERHTRDGADFRLYAFSSPRVLQTLFLVLPFVEVVRILQQQPTSAFEERGDSRLRRTVRLIGKNIEAYM